MAFCAVKVPASYNRKVFDVVLDEVALSAGDGVIGDDVGAAAPSAGGAVVDEPVGAGAEEARVGLLFAAEPSYGRIETASLSAVIIKFESHE